MVGYSFEKIGKLLGERELRLQRYKEAADKSWRFDGLRELSGDGGTECIQAALTLTSTLRKRDLRRCCAKEVFRAAKTLA